jgi:hypothetical protein
MSSEISQQVREAVDVLPHEALYEAGRHITEATEIVAATLGDGEDEVGSALAGTMAEARRPEHAAFLFNKGVRALSAYANELDGNAPYVSEAAPAQDDDEGAEAPALPAPKNAVRTAPRYGTTSVPKKKLRKIVDDIVQQQLANGFDTPPPPSPASIQNIDGRHISDYEDGELVHMTPLPETFPNTVLVDSLGDFEKTLYALTDVTNGSYDPGAVETLLMHEGSHAELDEVLIALYGVARAGGQIRHGLTITVTGPPVKGGFFELPYIPVKPAPFTIFGNISVPAIGLALASMYPTDPSKADLAGIRAQGFRDRGHVLQRVEEYNQRPGVKLLPLPKA